MAMSLYEDVFYLTMQKSSILMLALNVGDWVVIVLTLFASCLYLGDGRLWGKPDPKSHMWYEVPQKMGEFKVKKKQTRNIGKKLQETSSDIAILWGSQSGVSEAFAHRLARHWHSRFGLRPLVADLDEYDASSLSAIPVGTPCVFLCSTYGEGDPPDNAVNFCTALDNMKKRGTRLESLHYLALGMGNKNYKHYNRVIVVSAPLRLHGCV